MCDECHQSPHATMCPNNPALAGDHPIMKTCPICEREFDEDDMFYSVCDECLERNLHQTNAIAYGSKRTETIEINGYLAHEFSRDQIEEILIREIENMTGFFYRWNDKRYIRQDSSDFADWLVEQKKGGG